MFRLLLVTALINVMLWTESLPAPVNMDKMAVDFEVLGRVQDVNFRKYTKKEATKLGLRGWVKNTAQGTVLGHMQGPTDRVKAMMKWLQTKGSPKSKIEKAEFRNQRIINKYTFDEFSIAKDGENNNMFKSIFNYIRSLF